MGLLARLKQASDGIPEIRDTEDLENIAKAKKDWSKGRTPSKRGFTGRVLHVDDILIRDGDGKLRKKYVRENVRWGQCKKLANLTTTVKRVDYKPKLENGEPNPQFGKTYDSEKHWNVVVYRTDDLNVGEFRIFGEDKSIPLVRELALVYAEMMRLGIIPTYVHENGGLCVRGEPVVLGIEEDDLETVREKYHLSLARATSTAYSWIREKFYAKYGPEVGERLAKAELKKVLAPPRANPDNLWGYGLKNKEDGKYDRLNLGNKYLTDKAKRSKKGGGKGGGGAFRVGSESPVVKDLHRDEHRSEVAKNIAAYVQREMVKDPVQAETDLAIRKLRKLLDNSPAKVEPEEEIKVLDLIEARGLAYSFCKVGRRWVILDHKEDELVTGKKAEVEARWNMLKKKGKLA